MLRRPSSNRLRFTGLLTLLVYSCMAFNPDQALSQDRPTTSESREYMVTLREGAPAPFDGTLLNVPAAARILTDLRLREEECRVETNRRLGILEANMQLRIDTETARREALQYRHDQLVSIKDEQIRFLTENMRSPSWYQTGEFWYALGVVSGIAITIISAYALSLVDAGP